MTLIAQMTDLHLREDGAYGFHDPARALLAAFDDIAGLDQRPEVIVLTGDILDRSASDYAGAQALIAQSPVPVLVMPGNHDRAGAFRQAFGGQAWAADHLSFHHACGEVDLVALETTLPSGKAGVTLAQLDWLAALLPRLTRPILLALHHPPFVTGLSHLDEPGFANADALAEVIAGAGVCRVIAGHSHRAISSVFAGIAASTAAPLGFGLSLAFAPGARHHPVATIPSYELHQFQGASCITHQRLLLGKMRP